MGKLVYPVFADNVNIIDDGVVVWLMPTSGVDLLENKYHKREEKKEKSILNKIFLWFMFSF